MVDTVEKMMNGKYDVDNEEDETDDSVLQTHHLRNGDV